jgi:glycosyltransferase involved in cell wall biosynthesis
MKKNVILADIELTENHPFIKVLSEITKVNWEILFCGQWKNNNVKRITMYFFFPALLFLRRIQFDNVIAWQPFYGLLLAFYARIFHINKSFKLVIMMFIYKKKKGILGYIYNRFMHFSVTSKYIDQLIVYSTLEVNYYSNLFPSAKSKFIYIPLGIDKESDLEENNSLKQEKFILTTGRSNRDYDFLFETLINTQYHVKVISNSINRSSFGNIEIYNNILGREMLYYMNNCFCVVITLKDTNISSGQLVALQAMQLGKPIIVTKSDGISDYITHEYNGLIVKKEKQNLIDAIQRLYSDEKLYRDLSLNSKNEYEKKYSILNFGTNIGNCIKELIDN